MTVPVCKSKFNRPSVIAGSKMLKHLKKHNKVSNFKMPENVVLYYDARLLNHIRKNYKNKTVKLLRDIHILSDFNIAVCNLGMGAPSVCLGLELLRAAGAKNIITIGTAGTLQDNIDTSDIVLCSQALRDEGTSYHYLKSTRYSCPDKKLTEKIYSLLKRKKTKFHFGPNWTTDALYRETAEEIKEYKNENILTVDMEASAVFALCKYHKMRSAALFTVSDHLSETSWEPQFFNTKTAKGLGDIFDTAVEIFKNEKKR